MDIGRQNEYASVDIPFGNLAADIMASAFNQQTPPVILLSSVLFSPSLLATVYH